MTTDKPIPLAQLVELRRAKETELTILQKRIKVTRKQIREYNKSIQANLNEMVMTASKEPISPNNFGYEDHRDELVK
jgi:hypothetical protein